jgi:hypothetical protein
MKSFRKLLSAAFFSLLSLYWVSASAQTCTGTLLSQCDGTAYWSCNGYDAYAPSKNGEYTQCKHNSWTCNKYTTCTPPAAPAAPAAPTAQVSSSSTPTVAGTITWQFQPQLTVVSTSSCNLVCGNYYLYYMTGTVISNGSNSYSISGFGEAAFDQKTPATAPTQYFQVPGSGTILLSGGQYQMMINAMFQPPPQGDSANPITPSPVMLAMNCTLSTETLSGTCYSQSGQSAKVIFMKN